MQPTPSWLTARPPSTKQRTSPACHSERSEESLFSFAAVPSDCSPCEVPQRRFACTPMRGRTGRLESGREVVANKKVKWGVLSTASIGLRKVIPGMQSGEWSEIVAIASRDGKKGESVARKLRIPKAYWSYEELLADPEIEAVYNPLPNHLHVPWSIKAAEAGKHVLCEKPISLTVPEAISLLHARDRTGVKIEEAFMVRTHPQWLKAIDLVRTGQIGAVRSVAGYFSYFNRDPKNIRNIPEYGGGALMDIGCYLIYTSRLIFGEEPKRVLGIIERDPEMQTDVITSGVLDFPAGQAIFTCSTQVAA